MRKLIEGLRHFRTSYYPSHRDLFEQFAKGQHPRVLFITCSDSRIDPNLITQSGMGELFVIRNAGNLIPPFGAANGGEGASIEYAIAALNIEHVVVCGHSHCGAMKGLLKLNQLQEDMPLVYDWLQHAQATRRLVLDNYSGYETDDLVEILVAENVLTQIENLKTYPIVRSRLFQGKLQIFGWIYEVESGEVLQISRTSSDDTGIDECPVRLPGSQEKAILGRCVVPLTEEVAVAPPEPEPVIAAVAAPPANYSSRGWLAPEQQQRIYRGNAS
ncbi:carbonic anhydrase [Synechococcus elongatus]|uniref:Carbonic anhydrase n=1 Tax=Synechococcus elongatus (strain ATCC 33912 / PCC 7942 / FACHB-805) TaxID=1140 RepID=CYNT_SYNE7|nr:carbonic anhydrase [Synechococcus elongatus]P27134.1 RecName: Full=Carbonic anhydrase; AltName: Full=Carbonate dehydratase [Synechococcus elongatus PCC 7942 = FACHB-805]AAA27315.1 carbonic anhydrase [Synechococcus sp.]ABB57477.1 Carbonate dehydratase [Synechococcus elongatus PCC 7942 = FACHB-805]AJD58021.1 carbonic anhydrase [Synechococcus elongatus UTEX 2973]MBD2588489.1 carbonic anhydrase [Synechococcus elongatus FACHB-242]MBD2689557.1 carbonic anhydrase [Synechococcus elongatus FACHB-10